MAPLKFSHILYAKLLMFVLSYFFIGSRFLHTTFSEVASLFLGCTNINGFFYRASHILVNVLIPMVKSAKIWVLLENLAHMVFSIETLCNYT